ncbi:hypothetical protein SDC9_23740 [bioreactor metagenome]|uniref:DISARM protein DrmE C-terminal domain-containing protein n=1 Tax=bioreactor metagenome TaxID=1076179 RepID=A0A644UG72_9ZZZZ
MDHFSPPEYSCTSDWEEIFTEDPDNRSRVVWLQSKKYLNITGQPLYLNAINRQSICFYKCCLKHKKEGLLIYPTHDLCITSLLALEGLYYNYANKHEFDGKDKILIISSRVSLRNEIREYFKMLKAGSLPIYYQLFPVARVTSNGGFNRFSDLKKTNVEPKLFISPNLDALPAKNLAEQIFCVIVEADSFWDSNKEDVLRNWIAESNIAHLFWIASDPTPPYFYKLIESKQLPYWGWNAEELKIDSQFDESSFKAGDFDKNQPFCQNYDEIQNKFSGIIKVIVPVKEDYLNKEFKKCRKTYFQLLESARKSRLNSGISFAYRFIGCVNVLEETISPLSYSEKQLEGRWGYTSAIKSLKILESQAESIKKESPFFSSYAIDAVDRLKAIYHYMLEKKSGKYLVILEIINEALQNNKRIVIIAKNGIYRSALEDYLIKEKNHNILELNENGIYFSTIDDISRTFNDIGAVTTCVLYGCPRYYNNFILSLSKTERLGIVVYESEIPFLKTMFNVIDDMKNILSSEKKGKSVSGILSSQRLTNYMLNYPSPSSKQDSRSKIITICPTDAELGDFTYKSIMSDFFMEELDIENECAEDFDTDDVLSENEKDYRNTVPAIKVSFSSGKSILLRVNKQVQIFDNIRMKVKDITASHLAKNHILILVENSTKKTISSSIISKVRSDPKMTAVIFYQKYWIKCLSDGMFEYNDTPNTLLEKLWEKGAKSPETPTAIYLWLKEAVLGPQDPENIRRIGEIYNKELLIRDWKLVAESIKRLRGIHRGLARKLYHLIPKAAIEFENQESENTIIDEELELSLEDFRNSISLEMVISCEKVGDIPISQLDKLNFNTQGKYDN